MGGTPTLVSDYPYQPVRDGNEGESMEGVQSAGEANFQPVSGQKEATRLAQKRRIAEDASQRKKSAERKRALARSVEKERLGRDDLELAKGATAENPATARTAPKSAAPKSVEERLRAGQYQRAPTLLPGAGWITPANLPDGSYHSSDATRWTNADGQDMVTSGESQGSEQNSRGNPPSSLPAAKGDLFKRGPPLVSKQPNGGASFSPSNTPSEEWSAGDPRHEQRSVNTDGNSPKVGEQRVVSSDAESSGRPVSMENEPTGKQDQLTAFLEKCGVIAFFQRKFKSRCTGIIYSNAVKLKFV